MSRPMKRATAAKAPPPTDTPKPATAEERRGLRLLAIERLTSEVLQELFNARDYLRGPVDDGPGALKKLDQAIERLRTLDSYSKALLPEGGWVEADGDTETVGELDLAWKGLMSRLRHVYYLAGTGASQDARFSFLSVHLGAVADVFDLHEKGKHWAKTNLFMGPVDADGTHTLFVQIAPQAKLPPLAPKPKGKAR